MWVLMSSTHFNESNLHPAEDVFEAGCVNMGEHGVTGFRRLSFLCCLTLFILEDMTVLLVTAVQRCRRWLNVFFILVRKVFTWFLQDMMGITCPFERILLSLQRNVWCFLGLNKYGVLCLGCVKIIHVTIRSSCAVDFLFIFSFFTQQEIKQISLYWYASQKQSSFRISSHQTLFILYCYGLPNTNACMYFS